MGYIYAKRPPRAIEYPYSELLELATYVIKGDQLNYGDTSPHLLFDIPAGTLIVGIGWKVQDGFGDTGVLVYPEVRFTDSAGTVVFGMLTNAELGSSNRYGFIPSWYESTAAMKIEGDFSSGGDLDAGAVDIWLMYRPMCEAQRWTNKV